jgi:hypothetical protein
MVSKKVLAVLLFTVAVAGQCVSPSQADAFHKACVVKVGRQIEIKQWETVEGDVVGILGNVIVKGVVKGNVVCIGGEVELRESAEVTGDVISIGGKVRVEEGAKFRNLTEPGKRCFGMGILLPGLGIPPLLALAGGWMGVLGSWMALAGVMLLFTGILVAALVLNNIVAAVFHEQVKSVCSYLQKSPFKSFLVGILGMVSIFPLTLFLVLTIIGIALVPFALIAILCLWIFGFVCVAVMIGNKLRKRAALEEQKSYCSDVTIGTILLWVVLIIPVVRALVLTVALTTGFGAVIANIVVRESRNRPGDSAEVANGK